MRVMSASTVSCTSQKVPANSGEYSVRPSISTSSLLAVPIVKPRALMLQFRAPDRATSRLSASRMASAIDVTPERRMSSWRMTVTAAAV